MRTPPHRPVAAPTPVDEQARLASLEALGILDTDPEEAFDDLVTAAALITEMEMAAVSFIAGDRQWLKSSVGLSVQETPRAASFCAHAILEREVMVVRDARRDPRFADNPYVCGEPGLRAYVGVVIRGPRGHALGTVCTIDRQAQSLTPDQIEELKEVGARVERLLARRAQPARPPLAFRSS